MPKKVTINTEIRPLSFASGARADRYMVRITYVQGAASFDCKGAHDLGLSLYDAQNIAFTMREHITQTE